MAAVDSHNGHRPILFVLTGLIVLSALLAFSLESGSAVDAESFTIENDGVSYEVTTESAIYHKVPSGCVMITKFVNHGSETVDIPPTISHGGSTYRVEAIAEFAYNGGATKSILVPDSVNYVGRDAFKGCYGLVSVSFASKNLVIGDFWGSNPFPGISSIESVTFHNQSNYSFSDGAIVKKSDQTLISYVGNETDYEIQYGVERIGWGAFDDRPVRKVILPISVHTIDVCAFYNAKNLEYIGLSNVRTIDHQAFEGTAIRNLVIPPSVKEIKSWLGTTMELESITVDPENTSVWTDGHSLVNRDGLIVAFTTTMTGSYTVPGKVKTIPEAFYYSNLSELIISEGVTSIEQALFHEKSYNLKRISYPSTLKWYGAGYWNGFNLYDSECRKLDFTFQVVYPETAASMVAGKTYSGDVPNELYEEVISTIAYDVDGGSVKKTSDKGLLNRYFTVPSYDGAKTGYCFNGWYLDDTLYDEGQRIVLHSKTVTLKASWIDPPYRSVTYDLNGGSGYVVPQSVQQGSSFTVKHYDGIKQNHTFQGWSYDNRTYDEGDSIVMGKRDILLEAVWQIKPSHSIVYNVNGKIDSTISQSEYEGNTFTLKSCSGLGFGERFTGWSYGGEVYPVGASFVMGTGDMYFTANTETDLNLYIIMAATVILGVVAAASLMLFMRRKTV